MQQTTRIATGRIAAVSAATGALVHLVVAVGAAGPSWPARLVIVAMAALCSWCVPALWRGPDLRGWTVTAAMLSAMLLAHLFVLHPLLESGSPSTDPAVDPVAAIGMPVMHALPVATYVIALAAMASLARPSRPRPAPSTRSSTLTRKEIAR